MLRFPPTIPLTLILVLCGVTLCLAVPGDVTVDLARYLFHTFSPEPIMAPALFPPFPGFPTLKPVYLCIAFGYINNVELLFI